MLVVLTLRNFDSLFFCVFLPDFMKSNRRQSGRFQAIVRLEREPLSEGSAITDKHMQGDRSQEPQKCVKTTERAEQRSL